MIKRVERLSWALLLVGLRTVALGADLGTSAGLSLLEAPSAKAAALGGALSALPNEISSFGYNPASLVSLDNPRASFMYQKGSVDDTYGHFLFGTSLRRSYGWGGSLGYYDSGTIDVVEQGRSYSVRAQQDLVLALGAAAERGSLALGVTGKMIRSQLVETYTARAFAADFGASWGLSMRSRLGASLQNIGSSLRYIEKSDPLPRVARFGASHLLLTGISPTRLLVDFPYHFNERAWSPSLGLETWVGPLAIRGSYVKGFETNHFSIGTGFMVGQASLDYAFKIKNDLDSQHRISVAMSFLSKKEDPTIFARIPEARKEKSVTFVEQKAEALTKQSGMPVERRGKGAGVAQGSVPSASARKTLASLSESNVMGIRSSKKSKRVVYVIKQGDTLERIAHEFYGDREEWKNIFKANQHLMAHRRDMEPGKRIVIP